MDVSLVSESSRKSYTLQEVAGRQIGHVQYFLNRELKHSKGMLFIFQKSNITEHVNSWSIPSDYFPEIPVTFTGTLLYILKHDLNNGVTLII